jgi:hypothetical protein
MNQITSSFLSLLQPYYLFNDSLHGADNNDCAISKFTLTFVDSTLFLAIAIAQLVCAQPLTETTR